MNAIADERERRILDVIRALRPGEVTTYGDVAETAGYPKRSRLVGRILATTDIDVPWWRVVNAAGKLRSTDVDEQAALLRSENVSVSDGRVRDAPCGRFSRPVPRPSRPARPPRP
jgi:methylated-DNA-protein-cysteine methyltransferase-like protein